jgi:hypothetical protein
MRLSWLAALFGVLVTCGCRGTPLPRATGINVDDQVVNGRLSLGDMRFAPSLCQGIDVKPETTNLDEKSLLAFLKARGLPTRVLRARGDLLYVDVQVDPDKDLWGRLRVAILASPDEAGNELFEAVLQHGTGSWGVHRGNLAILAPIGNVEKIVAFVGKTKLACWGVTTVAKKKRTYVIPGGYREL